MDHLLSKETAERSNPPSRWSKEAKASGFQLIAQSKFFRSVLLYVIFSATNGVVARRIGRVGRAPARQLSHLGPDHELDSADGRLAFAAGDRIQFLKTDKTLGLTNASVGTIRHIENGRVFADIDGRLIGFDTAQYQNFRHGYAGTIYKGQGATVDQSYLYHSEHWRSAASYVGMTRHREKAELFVATNSAANLDQLARQMSRVDEGKRYAASHFHHRQEVAPVRPMTAREILEHFSGDSVRDPPEQNRRRPHVITQPAAEMRGARRARPLRQQQNPRPIRTDRQNEGTGKMDDYEDEEEQRKRRAGVGIDLNEADFKAAADKLRQTETVWRAWQQPAFSAETMAADPWTAVYLPIPEPETVLLDVLRQSSPGDGCLHRHGRSPPTRTASPARQ